MSSTMESKRLCGYYSIVIETLGNTMQHPYHQYPRPTIAPLLLQQTPQLGIAAFKYTLSIPAAVFQARVMLCGKVPAFTGKAWYKNTLPLSERQFCAV